MQFWPPEKKSITAIRVVYFEYTLSDQSTFIAINNITREYLIVILTCDIGTISLPIMSNNHLKLNSATRISICFCYSFWYWDSGKLCKGHKQ